jgi:hypothetical protein
MSLDAERFLAGLRRIVDRIERLTPADVAVEKNDIARDRTRRIEIGKQRDPPAKGGP